VLRASFGLGFRAPDFREQLLFFENPGVGYVVEGDPNLDPERSRNVTLGAELHPTDAVWASLSLFRNDLEDMISTELVSPGGADGPMRFQYQNVSSAYTQGLEASIRLNPMRGLRLDFSYAFTDTRDEELDRPLSGRPKHRGTMALRHREPSIGFETVWRAALVGERIFYEDTDGDGSEERRTAPAYTNLDLRVQQRVLDGLAAFFYAENVLDAGEPDLLTIPPRSFSIGLVYSR
jgi:outer membrane receptor for ferrienterochelin and colicins